jgi:hypothetical protein
MLVRMRVALLLILFAASFTGADNKKKNSLPTFVLKACTVVILIDPDGDISANSPLANKTAQEDVEKAIVKWGRLTPVIETQTADLVITVRKSSGKLVQSTIGGAPTNDRPVVVQPNENGIRIGGQQGHTPDIAQSGPQDTKPYPRTEIGPAEDMFIVYEGRTDAPGPLERPSVWSYATKDALHSPDVPAVAEFRKLIETAEK